MSSAVRAGVVEYAVALELERRRRARDRAAAPAPIEIPSEWEMWLRKLFPRAVRHAFAPHHRAFWEHVWSIAVGVAARPFLGIWSREGGKSSSVELACLAIGVRAVRPYGVYVRRTQERADDSVQNIATKLESPAIELHYPDHARPMLSKLGTRKGWNRRRVRTAGGFTIDAIGLDSAGRGVKIDDDRPGFIVFDDLDEELDTPGTTADKITTLTTAILPAGAEDCAVFGIQNLIIADGIFSQLVDGRADFLSDRIVSGPHPAVRGLKWRWQEDPESHTRVPLITAGEPTWAGQSIEVCQRQMRRWGPKAFEREAQHQVSERAEGLALNFDEAEHFVDWTELDIKRAIAAGTCLGGVDFGSWRFAFTGWVADEYGVIVRWGEIFSQREELRVRAKRMHDVCEHVGLIRDNTLVKRFPIWGDAANPTDIAELNAAFRDLGSPLVVIAVGMAEKARRTAVDRINEKLAEGALRLVRSVGAGDRWQLGYNAGNKGTPSSGSRLVWEIRHWSYRVPPSGKVDLKQDPDDHTADGADEIASARYALMSFWRPGKPIEQQEVDAFAPKVLAAEVKQRYTLRGRKKRARTSTRRGIDDE